MRAQEPPPAPPDATEPLLPSPLLSDGFGSLHAPAALYESGDELRLRRLFVSVWNALPWEVCYHLDWFLCSSRPGRPAVFLAERLPRDDADREVWGRCLADAGEFEFSAWALRRLDDRLAAALIAHELAHAWLRLSLLPWLDEALVDATAEGWGFAVRELRAFAG